MIEQDERLLIATYLTTSPPPTIGTVLNIKMFKEEEAYPDQVRVLSLEETSSDEPSIIDQAEIFDVIVEPAGEQTPGKQNVYVKEDESSPGFLRAHGRL